MTTSTPKRATNNVRERFPGWTVVATVGAVLDALLPGTPGRRSSDLCFAPEPGRSDASGSTGGAAEGDSGRRCRGSAGLGAAGGVPPGRGGAPAVRLALSADSGVSVVALLVACADGRGAGGGDEAIDAIGGGALVGRSRFVVTSGASGSKTGCERGGVIGFDALADGAVGGAADVRLANPRFATSFCGLMASTRSRQ